MRAILGGVVQCESCQEVFSALPTFYVACNCTGDPLTCPHRQCDHPAIAVYVFSCGNCGSRIEHHEHLIDPSGREEG